MTSEMNYSEMQLNIAISTPEHFDIDPSITWEMIDELTSLSNKIEIYLFPHRMCKLKIALLKDDERNEHLSLWKRPDLLDQYKILSLSWHVPFSYDLDFSAEQRASEEFVSQINLAIIPRLFAKRVCDLLITCNLCTAVVFLERIRLEIREDSEP